MTASIQAMDDAANELCWDGSPGHYEVYYLSATDPDSGVGLWLRYTMLAPQSPDEEASCALWVMAMDPDAESSSSSLFARKLTLPITALDVTAEPFELRIGEATLNGQGMSGSFQDVSWDLRWHGDLGAYHHVHPLLRRARVAKTVLVLPRPDLSVYGTVCLGDRVLRLDGARGGQAHLWGSKHAARWAWVHANDLRTPGGERVPDSFLDAVSVFVPRLGRELGPSTPLVARFAGEDFICTSPLRVMRNHSRFGLTHWNLQAQTAERRLTVEVNAPRERLLGVTYQDPDGQLAYCYNTEIASLRLYLWERSGSRGRPDWRLSHELLAPSLAHFEYAQREPLTGMPLLL
jgi:hypothetical protein